MLPFFYLSINKIQKMLRSVYVAATSQHVGKTTSTLGLVAALSNQGHEVGYCKPVGQQFLDLGQLKVDKDALLFSKVMDFELSSELHSPVILGRGATTAFLDNPDTFHFADRIRYAASHLQKENEIVIYEGTGHPGVGSVVGLSNADVAKMLNSKVIIIVEGGIGNTIDRLELSYNMFKSRNVEVIGVIVNKVLPEKIEKVTKYVGMHLEKINLPLLGVLPFDSSLSYPIMFTIAQAINGRVLLNNTCLNNHVEGYISGSLIDQEDFDTDDRKNLLLVVSFKRLKEALDKINKLNETRDPEKAPLISGVVITGDGKHELPIELSALAHNYIKENKLPVVTTALDTLGSVVKITNIEVKINTHTPWKAKRAIELITKHVNLNAITNYKKED